MSAPLTVFVVAFSGLLGLAVGSFLNVVAYRVPAGVSLLRESRCPSCAAPVRWWQNAPVASWFLLRGRCASCRSPISARYPIVEAVTGAVFAGVAAWWAAQPGAGTGLGQWAVFAAFLWFAAAGIVLTVIDLDVRRLPHVITGTTLAVCAALLGVASLLAGDAAPLIRALTGAAAVSGFYALLRVIRPDGMGGGDVRLAAVVGLMLGWLGWGPLLVGGFAAFVLGGVFGVALLARGRAHRRTAIPFGPWIVVGAWIGVVAGEALGRSYLALYPVLL
ncbi:prepilin peptidase [Microbacterium sp. ET2]|uniref:prepilin peptidase n=1 Tax=Microbacterium albipurpureum TaxID=3050384 RepID=UPI00259D214A|nr:A24 family peptidase [Microbacterium sp. ET2 (Ac-2212)]WJL94334.1 prepilin peptidase [Microbacterium sp. ET2 (Ac-2212)]